MKRSVITAAALMVCACANAQTAIEAHAGREPIRGKVLCYPSAEEALAGGVTDSKYIQPLSGRWMFRTLAEGSPIEQGLAAKEGWTEIQVPQKEPAASALSIYRREYKMPFAWIDRQLFLHVGAVDSPYEIYINDKFCGHNRSGRVAAEFDITGLSREGVNTLSIAAYGSCAENLLVSYDKKPRTQIAGEVYVMAQPRVRVRDYTARTDVSGRYGNLEMGFILKSHLLNPKELTVYYELYDPQGVKVSEERRDARFEMKLEDTVRFFVSLPDVRPWSHETPDLYTLRVRTRHEGRITEYLSFKVGFRKVEMANGSLKVNGYPVPLTVSTYAPPYDAAAMERDLRELKDSGINCVKLKDHPADDVFYALCDSIGLYVCDQADINTSAGGTSIAKGGNSTNDPAFEAVYRDRILGMYHASKMHPSAVMFSMAEESANGYNLYEGYLALRNAEPDRPIVYSGAGNQWNSDASARGSSARIAFDPEAPRSRLSTPPPFTSYEKEDEPGVFAVSNNMYVTKAYRLYYTIGRGGKVKTAGYVDTEIGPQETAQVRLPDDKYRSGKGMQVRFGLAR